MTSDLKDRLNVFREHYADKVSGTWTMITTKIKDIKLAAIAKAERITRETGNGFCTYNDTIEPSDLQTKHTAEHFTHHFARHFVRCTIAPTFGKTNAQNVQHPGFAAGHPRNY
ncbi:hypothetical protein MBLNU457_g0500t1 [Dothideomycetes sp. NU457]